MTGTHFIAYVSLEMKLAVQLPSPPKITWLSNSQLSKQKRARGLNQKCRSNRRVVESSSILIHS